MKTAGVVFDFYDDVDGSLLKKEFPTTDVLPEVVKTAHILSPEERDVLRDEAYALIMVNEGKTLRKFACVDAGNTLLSALYFHENKDKLPEEAQKIAAANILAAAEEFGLNLEKTAAKTSPQRTRDPMKDPLVGDEADWAQRTNLISQRGGGDSGKVAPTAMQMKTASKDGADNVDKALAIGAAGASVANLGNQVRHAMAGTHSGKKGYALMAAPAVALGAMMAKRKLQGKKALPANNAKTAAVANIIDVTGLAPEMVFEKKAAPKHLALNQYPLDSYADVQKAVEYFQETYTAFSPEDRHEYCVKTASRAEALGIEVPDLVSRYGSTEYSPDLEAHLAHRKSMCDREFHGVYDALCEKRAFIEPTAFAQLLSEADAASGLDWHYPMVSDPYFATFGGDSKKEKLASWNWASPSGEAVSATQLQELAETRRAEVERTFSADAADAFAKDPVAIFESMPEPQKVILARLATGEH